MIDRNRDQNKTGTLPAFAPVPRTCNRHDGWTAERQRGFIEALADTGSVRAAARAVNMTSEGAYQLRPHPEAEGFRAAWEAALACGIQRLEDIAMERAIEGVEVPVLSCGRDLGTRRVYNDRLLMFLLRNRASPRFRAGSYAEREAQLARLHARWREEWEAERLTAELPDLDEVRASILRKIEVLDAHERKGWSEDEIRLDAEFKAARERRAAQEAREHAARWSGRPDAPTLEEEEEAEWHALELQLAGEAPPPPSAGDFAADAGSEAPAEARAGVAASAAAGVEAEADGAPLLLGPPSDDGAGGAIGRAADE